MLDITHVILEEYEGNITYNTHGEKIINTYIFDTEDMEAFSKAAKQFVRKEQNRIVSVKLITDEKEYKKEK